VADGGDRATAGNFSASNGCGVTGDAHSALAMANPGVGEPLLYDVWLDFSHAIFAIYASDHGNRAPEVHLPGFTGHTRGLQRLRLDAEHIGRSIHQRVVIFDINQFWCEEHHKRGASFCCTA